MPWPRIQAHWRLKLGLAVAISVVFWTGYGVLGRQAFLPLRRVALTWIDQAVAYRPEGWAWVYLSQFLLTGALPWLLPTREGVWRYAKGLGLMVGVGFLVFFLFPTAGPRPAEVGGHAAMRIIACYDGPLNAMPSMHASFLVYMGALAWRMFGRQARWWMVGVAMAWGGSILFATLATKQHYVLDLLAGGLLGLLSDAFAWHGCRDVRAACTMPMSAGSRSQSGSR